ncbi:outer membrane beta-barrel protein [Persicirhabdus sediminis]|uniref:Outer membrane beta-barrel protein n=1 Tax=Persicirhabdus sediminis TaxID=454144 RepID=A0A8J7SK69_9BACT|nr:outer membrane beta-barrel protein [Persicirhabdus sediminis]MBK1792645.1 outer membrane beta-barrel protein [Persicirhabdus sediminis]
MKKSFLSLGLLASCTAPLLAGDISDSIQPSYTNQSEWAYSITPYIWAAGLSGDVGVNGNIADVDASFSDILSNLEFAGFIHADAMKNDKWGFYGDFQYLKINANGSASLPISNSVDLDVTQIRFELGMKYRAYKTDRTTIDLLVGGQYNYLKNGLTLTGPNRVVFKDSTSEDWIDPVIGAKWSYRMNEKWTAGLFGQVGGFGVASDFSWQAMATLSYDINECWSIIAAYRNQYIDYSNDGFVYKTDTSGPVLGASYTF